MPYFFDQLLRGFGRLFRSRSVAGLAAIWLSGATAIAGSGEFLLGYEAQGYRPGIVPEVFHILSVGGNYQHSTRDSEFKFDADFSFSAQDLRVWAFRSENSYWSLKPKKPSKKGEAPGFGLSIGRKNMVWNELDTEWNLSLVQPIDQWDRFRPAQQGLMGLFLDYDTGPLVLHGFFSYFVYPENIPNVVIENGAFLPLHPQAISSVPETVNLLNQTMPLYYEIEFPSISEFLFRPSAMLGVETKPKDEILFRALYGYKPLNYMNFGLRGYYSMSENRVRIFIRPRLQSNQIIAGDLGYRFLKEGFSFGISGLAQIHEPDEISPDYTYAPVTNSYLISPWVKWKARGFDGSVSALVWTGGLEPDVGPYAIEGASVLSSHVFYRKASQVKTGFAPLVLPEGSRVQLRWIHEFDLAADWIGGDLFIPVKTSLGNMKFTIGGDFIHAGADMSPNLGGELLVDLRPLDHVRIGVQFAI